MIVDDLFQNLEKIDFTQMDFDKVLDNRDLPEFDEEWIRIFNNIEAMKKEKGFSEQSKSISNNIREKVYLKIYDLTQDDSIAGYASDDFGLICDSEFLEYNDDWLDKFIKSYDNLQFPNGKL